MTENTDKTDNTNNTSNSDSSNKREMSTPVKIIIALLLPPIAAAQEVGMTRHFFINNVLTFAGGVPGAIHAVWLICRKTKVPAQPAQQPQLTQATTATTATLQH